MAAKVLEKHLLKPKELDTFGITDGGDTPDVKHLLTSSYQADQAVVL